MTRASILALAAVLASAAGAQAQLTIFHNNDGESRLLGDVNYGGVAYFVSALDDARAAAAARDQLTLSSGDNFLAGAAFNASRAAGTYYDALALAAIGYDAITLGNHDFDFGPDTLADFIAEYRSAGGAGTYLSSNLDFSGVPSLNALVGSGGIASSVVLTKGSNTYGVIGATTETLPSVSNPGGVLVSSALAAIQGQVSVLEGMGVDKIILSSHLQNLMNETTLATQLRGVDVIIAGGGDELLLNSDNARNTVAQAHGPYPVVATDLDGNNVVIVTTTGEYNYVGQLNVDFDSAGRVTSWSGDPILVDKSVYTPNAGVQTSVIDPLNTAIAAANALQIATTDVFLEHSEGGTNGPRAIRSRETNLGNLVADAFVWAVQNENVGLTPGAHLVGVTNSGGIRDDLDNDENGVVTQGEAQAVLPFDNTMAVVGGVGAADLVAMLENAVSAVPAQNGKFGHVSGIEFDFNPDLPAGARVLEVRLADGTPVWDATGGALTSALFDVATNSFVASRQSGNPLLGGDDYPLPSGANITLLSTLYADALIGYLSSDPAIGGLGGVVTAAAYPLEGAGRINAVPEPTCFALLAAGMGALALLRRRV